MSSLYIKSVLCVLLVSVFFVAGCQKKDNTLKKTEVDNDKVVIDINNENLTKEKMQDAIFPDSSITLPSMPEQNEADATLVGIDSNSNQIRDDLEVKIYQILNFAEDNEDYEGYNKSMELIKYIQPKDDAIQVIDEYKFYCMYTSLPKTVQDKISMNEFEYMVTNTHERHKAFYNNLKSSNFSTGEEICENK